MEWIQLNATIILAVIGALLAIDRWVKLRELKELKIQHNFQLIDIKAKNDKLNAQLKHDSAHENLQQTVNRVEKEMLLLREKASERHGEIQGRMGSIELRMNEFIHKHNAQIDELFRLTGRRETDLKAH